MAGSQRTRLIRRAAGRVAGLAATLLVTSFVVFSSLFLVPGDPISLLVRGRSPSAAQIADLRRQYGLNEPFLERYWHWLTGVLHGDLGRSFLLRDDVTHVLAARLPTTLSLVVLSGLMIGLVGLITGAYAALRRGRFAEQLVLTGVTVGFAIPPFVAAIVLKSFLAVRLGWFPTFGIGTGLLDHLRHLVLPSVALSITYIALVTRVTRSAMLEELHREHVEVAISRGTPSGTVIRKHVFRNALGPIATVSGTLVAGLLVSSSIVEYAFGLPGIGSLLVQSVDTFDFPVVQAIVLFVVVAFVAVNTIVDLLYPLIDPRLGSATGSR